MSFEPAFAELMTRLRGGDPEAAEVVFRRFAVRLIGLARVNLDSRLQQKLDPEDVVQSAFKSFFVRHADGQYELDDWDSLWSLLTVVTLRKCGHRCRHFRAMQRDVRREEAGGTEPDEGPVWAAICREPTPQEAFEFAEVVEGLFRGLGETDRLILQSTLQGSTPQQVSQEAGVSGRTVYRLLERIKGRLLRQISDPVQLNAADS